MVIIFRMPIVWLYFSSTIDTGITGLGMPYIILITLEILSLFLRKYKDLVKISEPFNESTDIIRISIRSL